MARVMGMSELTFEIPIDQGSETAALTRALNHVRVIHVLEFRSDGFLLVCRGTREGSALLKRSLSAEGARGFGVQVLKRDKSGAETLLVAGRWLSGWGSTLDAHRERELKFFREMEKSAIYKLGNPSFDSGMIRVSVIAEERMVKKLLSGLTDLRIPYTVVGIGPPKDRNDALDSLTARQVNVLRLAHAMGYFDVPKRAGTEDLARVLRMDRGTVGEHLRRAERNVFEHLLA